MDKWTLSAVKRDIAMIRKTVVPGQPAYRLAEYVEDLLREHIELVSKTQFLVDYLHDRGIINFSTFTFPDGDTWEATDQ